MCYADAADSIEKYKISNTWTSWFCLVKKIWFSLFDSIKNVVLITIKHVRGNHKCTTRMWKPIERKNKLCLLKKEWTESEMQKIKIKCEHTQKPGPIHHI